MYWGSKVRPRTAWIASPHVAADESSVVQKEWRVNYVHVSREGRFEA